jgi:hypothetical protein
MQDPLDSISQQNDGMMAHINEVLSDWRVRRPAWPEIIVHHRRQQQRCQAPLEFCALQNTRHVHRLVASVRCQVFWSQGLNERFASSSPAIEFIPALRYVYDMLKGEGASSAGYVQEQSMLGTASAKAIRHNYCLKVSFSVAGIRDYLHGGEWSGLFAALLSLMPPGVDQ